MNQRMWYTLGLAALLGAGCGSSPDPAPAPGPQPHQQAVADDPAEPQRPLPEWLGRPRAELAAACDAWAEKVQRQRTLYRQHQLRFDLLRDLRLPLAVPVWRQAHFSAGAGCSLPPYLPEGTHDAGLALHMARFGDVEAARRLADPSDTDTLARVDRLRLGRNYPAEWTRLAGLMLYHAEFRLAAGDKTAAGDLIQLHRELRQALDPQAQASPLGAALLPRGRSVLRQMTAVWRASDQADRASQAERALADWGEAPPLELGLPPGSTRAEAARLLGTPAKGRALVADSLRALDVLGLPLPDDGAEAVVACLDAAGRVAELVVVYRAGLEDEYRRPQQLAQLLDEPAAGEDLPGELPRRLYRRGASVCEVTLTPRSPFTSALVRVAPAAGTSGPQAGVLPRDLGPVHLSRSFGRNRVGFVPRQQGSCLVVTNTAALARLRVPVPVSERAAVTLQCDGGEDLLASLTVRYAVAQRRRSLAEIALPLWQALGAGRLGGSPREDVGLRLAWEDGQTRYVLRLPQTEEEVPELEVADRPDGQDPRQRAQRARAWDRRERQERLARHEPLTRLPRELEGLRLGTPRAETLSLLPAGAGTVRRELPDGVLVTVVGPPPKGDRGARELFVRFDPSGRAAELRVHYVDAAAQKTAGTKKLLTSFADHGGAPDEGKGPEGGREYRWQDDLTALVCRRDGSGLDVLLRDRPLSPDGDAPPAVGFLPRGPEHCTLGMSREDLASHWGALGAAAGGQPPVLTPKETSPYDALLVWLEAGRVVRVVARHRQPEGGALPPAEAGQAVTVAWGRDAAELGWPRRQDGAAGVVRAWANHDDRTQVRVFWQQNPGEGPRVYTEWKEQGRP
jgi:hypothetical protein